MWILSQEMSYEIWARSVKWAPLGDNIKSNLFQTVHFKVHDPKMHCKGSSRENTINRGGGGNYGSMQPPGPAGKYRPLRGPPMRYDEEAPPMHMSGLSPPMGPAPMMGPHGPMNYMGPPMPPPHPLPPPMVPPPPPTSAAMPTLPTPPEPRQNPTAPGVPVHTDAPGQPPPNPDCDMKDLNKMFGMTASDIDKYSRIFFPVTFTCFQLMYWIIYQHLSDEVIEDLVYLHSD